MASGCHCSRACSSLDVGRGSALACLRKPLRRCVPLFPLLCVPSPLLLALRPELTPLVGAPHGPVFHRRCLTRERAHATETCSLAPAIHDPRDGGVRCRPLSPDHCPTSTTTAGETNSHDQHAFRRRTMAPTRTRDLKTSDRPPKLRCLVSGLAPSRSLQSSWDCMLKTRSPWALT